MQIHQSNPPIQGYPGKKGKTKNMGRPGKKRKRKTEKKKTGKQTCKTKKTTAERKRKTEHPGTPGKRRKTKKSQEGTEPRAPSPGRKPGPSRDREAPSGDPPPASRCARRPGAPTASRGCERWPRPAGPPARRLASKEPDVPWRTKIHPSWIASCVFCFSPCTLPPKPATVAEKKRSQLGYLGCPVIVSLEQWKKQKASLGKWKFGVGKPENHLRGRSIRYDSEVVSKPGEITH